MQTALIVLVVCYGLLITGALLSDRVIFQPQRSTYTDTDLIQHAGRVINPSPAQLIKLQSGDHRITALYVPNPEAAYTILFSHGNAEDLGNNIEFFELLRDAGFAVFAYDYRGYGTSEGRPSERGVYRDVEAAYDYLTRQLGVPPSRIISHGRSVGTGAAIHIAARRPVGGLIAESPFLSAFRVLTRVPLLPFDKFRNNRLMLRVKAPVLVIHGQRDQVIPFSHGQRIYELADPPKQHLWIPNAGHNDVLIAATDEYLYALKSFAASLPR